MEHFPPALEKLVEQFARLPGIGGKSAQRLAFHVLGLPVEEAQEFAEAILDAKRSVTCCPVCQNLTEGDGPCPICVSPRRDAGVVCVVAEAKDMDALGIKELTLVAQDTTRYGLDIYGKYSLADLVKAITENTAIPWIRLLYCYPDKITDELIDTFKKENK